MTAALVAAMREEAEAGGARFAMVGPGGPWPRAVRAAFGPPDPGGGSAYLARIPTGDKRTAPYDPHMNAAGHALLGEALADAVLRARSGPAPQPTRAASRSHSAR